MATLKATTVVAHPQTGAPTVLEAGSEAPKWADGILGEHLFAVAQGYADQKVSDLRSEIDRRNESREDDAKIPSDGNKADLVAALEADDATQA